MMWLTSGALLVTCLAAGAQSMCWELGHNPFTGAPKTRRVEALSVLVDWVRQNLITEIGTSQLIHIGSRLNSDIMSILPINGLSWLVILIIRYCT